MLNAVTLAAAAPATPRRGSGPQPRISAGAMSRYTALAPAITPAGSTMRPVPRITLARRVEGPEHHGAAEDHVGVRERRVERRAVPTERAVDRGPPASRTTVKSAAIESAMRTPVRGEPVGVAAASGAERTRHRGGDAAAHAARGHRLHQHEEWVHERHAGERLGAQPAHEHRVHGADPGLQEHDGDSGAASRSRVARMGPSSIARVRGSMLAGRGATSADAGAAGATEAAAMWAGMSLVN
jgi:hypothetical protein